MTYEKKKKQRKKEGVREKELPFKELCLCPQLFVTEKRVCNSHDSFSFSLCGTLAF